MYTESELTQEEKNDFKKHMENYVQFDAYKKALPQNKRSLYKHAKRECIKTITEKRLS